MLTYQLNFLSSCPHLLSAVVAAIHRHTSFKGYQGLNPGLCACRHSTTWATSSAPYCLYSDFFICKLTLPCLHPCPHSGWNAFSLWPSFSSVCTFPAGPGCISQLGVLWFPSFSPSYFHWWSENDRVMDAALAIPWGMFVLPAAEASLLPSFLGLRSSTDGSQRRPGMP